MSSANLVNSTTKPGSLFKWVVFFCTIALLLIFYLASRTEKGDQETRTIFDGHYQKMQMLFDYFSKRFNKGDNDTSVNTRLLPGQSEAKDNELKDLTESLRQKLKDAQSFEKITVSFKKCKEFNITNYQDPPCSQKGTTCLRTSLPEDLEGRIRSLTELNNMPVPKKFQDAIKEMRKNIQGTVDVLIMAAFSANHFGEGQALIQSLHEKVFPFMKNFTMIVYDLGLTKTQATLTRKYCRCKLLKFPLIKLPPWTHNLKCFNWKMMMLAAPHTQANVVFYGDTSTRFTNITLFKEAIQRTKKLGVQWKTDVGFAANPYRTLSQMFYSFGDSPCAHMSFPQVAGGFGMIHNEPFIKKAFVEPLLKCASHEFCLCSHRSEPTICPIPIRKYKIAECDRTDQSSITVVLAKLFLDKMTAFAPRMGSFVTFARDHKVNYFEQLAGKKGSPKK